MKVIALLLFVIAALTLLWWLVFRSPWSVEHDLIVGDDGCFPIARYHIRRMRRLQRKALRQARRVSRTQRKISLQPQKKKPQWGSRRGGPYSGT